MKTPINLIILLLCAFQTLFAQDELQQSTMFTAKNPDQLFIGGILESASINSDAHTLLDVSLNPITISFSIPIKSKEIAPSYANMMKAIREALQEGSSLQPNYAFSKTIREIKSYGELALFFGQQINPKLLFGTPQTPKPKRTRGVLSISQSYFSVDMDLQESISNDPKVLAQQEKLVYVNSIEFGRKGVLIFESDLAFDDVKAAIEDVLKDAGGSDAAISDRNKAILANTTFRCMTVGKDHIEEVTPDNPLTSLINYMNRKVTADDFGVPVSFSASQVKDHSIFANKYTLIH